MLKQTLSQKMLQKLSPQQIQLIKLLQVPTISLEQRVEEELEANPALEEGAATDNMEGIDNGEGDFETQESETEEPFELDEYLNDYMEDDPSAYRQKSNSHSSEEDNKTIPIALETSFYDHLEKQLGVLKLEDEKEEAIAHQILGSIDEDGYLRRDISSIVDDLMFAENVIATDEEVLEILKKIQQFDPPGVGARNLQECLLLQLDAKMKREDIDIATLYNLQLAKRILTDYFDEFSKKHFDKLKQLDVPEEDIKAAYEEILKLNPKPASGFSSSSKSSIQYIVPDFFIHNRDGVLELSMHNINSPELRVNDYYVDMLKSYKRSDPEQKKDKQRKEAMLFIKQKIDSAKWFIDAINQRRNTLLSTMKAIMEYQYDYFLTGDEKKLRPMILKDISEITGLDISTISRVVNSKFVQTEFGVKRLKDFFSESMQTTDGEEVSSLGIKKTLKEIIESENKKKPLSDEKLMKMLREKGYDIARRTVAKYREQLNIPVARLRKEM